MCQMFSFLLKLKRTSQSANSYGMRLKEELKKSTFSYSNIKFNMVQLLFFTGITSVLFDWLCTKMTDSVKIFSKRLSLQDHLLIVLMKLRLGLTNTDLAYRFKVSTIPAMAIVEFTLRNMPKMFKRNFKRCRCIIDCTEIFINRPSHMTSRSQSWSNYKHNNTMKYLIDITPAGAISFLSEGRGGRVADKRITKESGFYDLLEFNDEILADRGFLIAEELAACDVSHAKGKRQLSAQEVNTSRQLSRVRIHVECVIGRWKNFRILQTRIPVSQVDLLDDIVIVCGALTNLCKSVVPKKSKKRVL
uniref:DDE Tnp4 domain-containing protein n=1 Tax=Myripristis murdjan TaxID=586833 RepID=A0A667YEM8_9TELE